MAKYTHGHHESVLRSHRWRTAQNSAGYLLPYLRPDMSLLDVGAGPGTITADLAELVASVTCTEVTDDALKLSRDHFADRRLDNVRFEVQDVHALTHPDDAFDVVHAHQVLQHVVDPILALSEMRRVTKPGGLVAARDSDYLGFAWYPMVPELGEWLRLYRAAAKANGGEPDAGRRLLGWARAAGFLEVRASSGTWCFSEPADRRWWGDLWADRMRESPVALQLVDSGLATARQLADVADAWQRWADAEDGWFSVLHGEIVCRA